MSSDDDVDEGEWVGERLKSSSSTSIMYYRGVRYGRYLIKVGDVVELLNEEPGGLPHVGLVVNLFRWRNTPGKMLTVQWFYRVTDIVQPGFQDRHAANEIFLSKHTDVNSLQAVRRKCLVQTTIPSEALAGQRPWPPNIRDGRLYEGTHPGAPGHLRMAGMFICNLRYSPVAQRFEPLQRNEWLRWKQQRAPVTVDGVNLDPRFDSRPMPLPPSLGGGGSSGSGAASTPTSSSRFKREVSISPEFQELGLTKRRTRNSIATAADSVMRPVKRERSPSPAPSASSSESDSERRIASKGSRSQQPPKRARLLRSRARNSSGSSDNDGDDNDDEDDDRPQTPSLRTTRIIKKEPGTAPAPSAPLSKSYRKPLRPLSPVDEDAARPPIARKRTRQQLTSSAMMSSTSSEEDEAAVRKPSSLPPPSARAPSPPPRARAQSRAVAPARQTRHTHRDDSSADDEASDEGEYDEQKAMDARRKRTAAATAAAQIKRTLDRSRNNSTEPRARSFSKRGDADHGADTEHDDDSDDSRKKRTQEQGKVAKQSAAPLVKQAESEEEVDVEVDDYQGAHGQTPEAVSERSPAHVPVAIPPPGGFALAPPSETYSSRLAAFRRGIASLIPALAGPAANAAAPSAGAGTMPALVAEAPAAQRSNVRHGDSMRARRPPSGQLLRDMPGVTQRQLDAAVGVLRTLQSRHAIPQHVFRSALDLLTTPLVTEQQKTSATWLLGALEEADEETAETLSIILEPIPVR